MAVSPESRSSGAAGIASTSTAHLRSGATAKSRPVTDLSISSPNNGNSHQPYVATRRLRKTKERAETAGGGGRWRIGDRRSVNEAFRQFGEHCARNQIRTLIIDCLVMTNLFYPALTVYLQKRTDPLPSPAASAYQRHRSPPKKWKEGHDPMAVLTSPWLDSLFPYPPPLIPRLGWAGWWARDQELDLGVRAGWSGSVAKTNGRNPAWEEDVALMRVAWTDVSGVLDTQEGPGRPWIERDQTVVDHVRVLAEEWERQYPDSGESCIRSGGTTGAWCYILATDDIPHTTLLSDLLIDNTYSHALGLANTTSGWGFDQKGIYRSVAVPFRIPKNGVDDLIERWFPAMETIAGQVSGEMFMEAEALLRDKRDWVTSWHVTYQPPQDRASDDKRAILVDALDLPPRYILVLYALLFGILSLQISDATKVHSRFGLAFTGILQLVCSTVMSFSILSLIGWNGWGLSATQTTLPTYVLPFVIVVVGVENMSTLIKAVFTVPFEYSVPVRIGLGLSKVGKTIAITSLTDLALLLCVWLCVNLRPVREFCEFAAVVIITDWFMLHTFFLTVLSIDAQRLELADVLSTSSPVEKKEQEETKAKPVSAKTGWSRYLDLRRLLRARTTKNFSLGLLLLFVGAIYYQSDASVLAGNKTAKLYGYNPSTTDAPAVLPIATTPTPYPISTGDLLHPAETLWRALNPSGWPAVRLVVPAASILVLPISGHSMQPADIRQLSLPARRLLLPRLKPLLFFWKIMIMPPLATAGILYVFLLYLLKDSQLLDAQRDKMRRSDPQYVDETEADGLGDLTGSYGTAQIDVRMLPCSHAIDIEALAVSGDGSVAMSVGVDDSICIWRFADAVSINGSREVVRYKIPTADGSVTKAAVSNDGAFLAVATTGNKVFVWENHADKAIGDPNRLQLSLDSEWSIRQFLFLPMCGLKATPTKANADSLKKPRPDLLMLLSDGSAIVLNLDGEVTPIFPNPEMASNERTFILCSEPTEIALLRVTRNAMIVWRFSDDMWYSQPLTSTVPSMDVVTSATSMRLRGGRTVVLGHHSGAVEVFDHHGEIIASIQPDLTPSSDVTQTAVFAPDTVKCRKCSSSTPSAFLVVSSTSKQIYVDLVCPRSAVWCRCNDSRRLSVMDDSKESGSSGFATGIIRPPSPGRGSTTPGNSPRRSPSLHPPVSNGEFPLSSHGVARRLSGFHRDEDKLHLRPPSPEVGGLGSSSMSPSHSTARSNELEVHPLGSVNSTGPWAVLDGTLVGLRRSGPGIDDSQWQVWTIDLSSPWTGSRLAVSTASFASLAKRTALRTLMETDANGGTEGSMRNRRAERLSSMGGRTAFPASRGSMSVPVHPALAYIDVRPLVHRGERGIVAGFGNRIGLISLPGRPGELGRQQGSRGVNGIAGAPVAPAAPPRRDEHQS